MPRNASDSNQSTEPSLLERTANRREATNSEQKERNRLISLFYSSTNNVKKRQLGRVVREKFQLCESGMRMYNKSKKPPA